MWPLFAVLAIAPAVNAQSFTDHGVVLTPQAGTFYVNGIGAPAVAYDPGQDQYVMLFETKIPDNGTWFDSATFSACPGGVRVWGLGRATSSDGLSWTADSDPVLLPEAGTDWGCVVAHPVMVFDGTTWHVWYKAHDPGGQTGIGYASSTDGQTFTHHSSLVIANAALSFPAVARMNGTWHMLVTQAPAVYAATSPDGLVWNLDLAQPVVPPGITTWMPEEVYNPSLNCSDDGLGAPFQLHVGGRDYDDLDGSGQIEIGNPADIVTASVGFASTNRLDLTGWQIAASASETWDVQGGAQDWRHWDAMKVGSDFVVYYAQKKDIGGGVFRNHVGMAYSTPSTAWDEGQISDRDCVYSFADTGLHTGDTGDTDTGDTDTDTGDTDTDTDTVETGDSGPPYGGTGCDNPDCETGHTGIPEETDCDAGACPPDDTDEGKEEGCGCASAPHPRSTSLLALLLARRR